MSMKIPLKLKLSIKIIQKRNTQFLENTSKRDGQP